MSKRTLSPLIPLGIYLTLMGLACASGGDMAMAPAEPAMEEIPDRFVDLVLSDEAGGAAEAEGEKSGRMESRMQRSRGNKLEMASPPPPPGAPAPEPSPDDAPASNAPAAADAPSVRAWFPESFLWEPRVSVDGSASLDVPLPDTLTTWRVLGLGASREGGQSGAVAKFSTRMDLYADPLMPPYLRQGDRISLPVQLVNTTDQPASGKLSIQATGLSGGAASQQTVPAAGSALARALLTADRPGDAVIDVELEGADRVQKTLAVQPRGQKLSQTRVGVLGSGGAATFDAPEGALYARATLTLLPGPLGVVRSELSRPSASTARDQAWMYDLGVRGEQVLTSLGAPPDEDTLERLRELRLRALQVLVRQSFSSALAERLVVLDALQGPAGSAVEDPVAERVTGWLRPELIDAQLPDGSWPAPDRAPLQQMLALTAYAAEVVDDRGARLAAGAVFERNAAYLLHEDTADPYTAARIVCSGVAPAELEAPLREQIAAAVVEGDDGLRRIALPEGVVGLDGGAIDPAEALALAARALQPHEPELARELLAASLASYRPGRGFGDVFASFAAMDAILAVGAAEPPESLRVALSVDGAEAGALELRRDALSQVASLTIPAPTEGAPELSVDGSGAWPGLTWHLEYAAWVPWTAEADPSGLEVDMERGAARANHPVDVQLAAAGPRGEALVIRQGLPAGLIVDADSVQGATVRSVDDAELVLEATPGDGGLAEIRYQAIPTFQGALWSGPLSVELDRRPSTRSLTPPTLWEIGP